MMLLKRLTVGVVAVFLGFTVVLAAAWGVRQFKIYSLDTGFARVAIGDADRDVKRKLGPPHEDHVAKSHSQRYGICRFVVYRVGKKLAGGVTWSIGLDAQGNVVSKHRDDDGC
jgi:hypothetical protein